MEQDDGRHLFIPVAGSNEVVTVPIDELPEEVEDLLDILRAEEAPLALWLDFAKAYLAQVGGTLSDGVGPCCAQGPRVVAPRVQAPAVNFCMRTAKWLRKLDHRQILHVWMGKLDVLP
jgi:hypothetical protein